MASMTDEQFLDAYPAVTREMLDDFRTKVFGIMYRAKLKHDPSIDVLLAFCDALIESTKPFKNPEIAMKWICRETHTRTDDILEDCLPDFAEKYRKRYEEREEIIKTKLVSKGMEKRPERDRVENLSSYYKDRCAECGQKVLPDRRYCPKCRSHDIIGRERDCIESLKNKNKNTKQGQEQEKEQEKEHEQIR